MLFKKGICFFLFVTAALVLAPGLNLCQGQNLDKIRADGGAPPAPPIPWPKPPAVTNAPLLSADGGAPPAPPIPWLKPPSNSAQSILKADGGAPPAPPIPWGSSTIDMGSLEV